MKKKFFLIFFLLFLLWLIPNYGMGEVIFTEDFENLPSNWECENGCPSNWDSQRCGRTIPFGSEARVGPGHNSNNAYYCYKKKYFIYSGVAGPGTGEKVEGVCPGFTTAYRLTDSNANFGQELPYHTEGCSLIGNIENSKWTDIICIGNSQEVYTFQNFFSPGSKYNVYGLPNSFRTDLTKYINNLQTNEIYHRWYIKIPPNFDKTKTSGFKFWRYIVKKDESRAIYLNAEGAAKFSSSFFSMYIEPPTPNSSVWMNMYPIDNVNDNQWHCLELHMKLNSSAQKDGIVEFWVDGNMVFQNKSVQFAFGVDASYSFNMFGVGIGNVSNQPWDMDDWTAIAFDDIVVATDYIGPNEIEQSELNPPQNLEITEVTNDN